MKMFLIAGILGLSGFFSGCSEMPVTKASASQPCSYCTEKVTRVYNSKGIPIDWKTVYHCSVCAANCNQSCPAKCAECATRSVACCNR